MSLCPGQGCTSLIEYLFYHGSCPQDLLAFRAPGPISLLLEHCFVYTGSNIVKETIGENIDRVRNDTGSRRPEEEGEGAEGEDRLYHLQVSAATPYLSSHH